MRRYSAYIFTGAGFPGSRARILSIFQVRPIARNSKSILTIFHEQIVLGSSAIRLDSAKRRPAGSCRWWLLLRCVLESPLFTCYPTKPDEVLLLCCPASQEHYLWSQNTKASRIILVEVADFA